MEVLATGGSGFVGGRLIERLVADGAEVRALARSNYSAAKVAELRADPLARGRPGRDARNLDGVRPLNQ